MKVNFKTAEHTEVFTPYTLTIEVESLAESQVLRKIGSLDNSIPDLVRQNLGDENHVAATVELCTNLTTVHRSLDRELQSRDAVTDNGMVVAKRKRA